jgi:hypothetical protein
MLLVDVRGVPLSIIVTAASHHDVTHLVPRLDAVVLPRPAAASPTFGVEIRVRLGSEDAACQ